MTANGATQIEGAGSFTFKKVRSIVVKLKGGDDTLSVGNLQIGGNLTFNGGSSTTGNNLFIGSSRIGGTLTVLNGANSASLDQIDIQPFVEIGRNLIVNYGTGDSLTNLATNIFIGGNMSVTGSSTIDRVFMANVSLGGKLSLALGGGANTVDLGFSEMHKSVVVKGGAGIDGLELTDMWIGGSLIANLGNGDNEVHIDTTADTPTSTVGSRIGGKLAITTGTGTDTIQFGTEKPVIVGGAASFITGNEPVGVDGVLIDDTAFLSTVLVDLGGGNDQLFLESNGTADSLTVTIAGKLTVLGRGGNDTVQFGITGFTSNEVHFAVQPTLNGGTGDDTLTLSASNYRIDGIGGEPLTGVLSFTIA